MVGLVVGQSVVGQSAVGQSVVGQFAVGQSVVGRSVVGRSVVGLVVLHSSGHRYVVYLYWGVIHMFWNYLCSSKSFTTVQLFQHLTAKVIDSFQYSFDIHKIKNSGELSHNRFSTTTTNELSLKEQRELMISLLQQ